MLVGTMRTTLALLLAAALAAAPPPRAGAQPADGGAKVRAIGDEYLATLTDDSLYLRLKQGRPLDRLPDLSLARAEARAQKASGWLARLDAIPESGLPEEDRLSR
jgi:hypothetical protein